MARDLQSRVVITAEDKTAAAFQSVASKLKALSSAAKQVKTVAEQVSAVKSAMAAAAPAERISIYRQTAQRTLELARAHQEARKQFRAAAREMSQIGPPTQALAQRYQGLREQLQGTGRALADQKAVLASARGSMREIGVDVTRLTSEQRRLESATRAATDAQRRQHAILERRAQRREAWGAAMGIAGVGAARMGKSLASQATTSIAEFDIAVRKQREFTDIPAEAQKQYLIPQAKRIGQETQFTNLDIVKAQTASMQGLPSSITGQMKAVVAQGMIENVKNYALVMEADMQRAAEAIRSYLQATGKDISTKEKALAEAQKATNQLVKMAKLGGMNDDDVQQALKFAAATGTGAGLSPETIMAVAALARRGGLRGDEAGVFIRAASSKLVAPTKKGLTALNAAGIDYSKYVSMPDRLETSALEAQFKLQLGTGFTDKTRARLAGVLSDKSILGDRGRFIQAVTEAVEQQFPKTKKGTMRPSDRVNVAKAAGDFYKVSAERVDSQKLLDDIMGSNMTLAQLNAFFTDKHGGKAGITQRQRDEYNAARKELTKVGDDPDFAKRKADEIMGGIGGSFEQAKGAVENFVLAVGSANERIIKFGLDGFSEVLDSFSKLSTGGQQVATAFGALAAVGGGVYGSAKLLGLLTGAGGLSGSAVALNESAAALTAAAARLGGAGALSGATTAAAGGGAAATASRLPFLARLGLGTGVGAVAAGLGYAIYEIGQANAEKYKDVAPGEVHNEGRKRMHRANELYRQRMEDFKRDNKVELEGKADVKVDVSVKLDPKLEAKLDKAISATGHLSATGSTGVGSTGRTMPEASAAGMNY